MTEVLELLTSSGLTPVEAGEFEAAFVRGGRFSTLVFLLADLQGEVSRESMQALVQRAREWCRDNACAAWYSNEAGLNLIVRHDGKLRTEHIEGLPDSTGLNASILQSVTAIDRHSGSVQQVKTWIVLGRAWTVLRRLARLRSNS